MKGFDVLKVKSAIKGRNKFDLSRTHLTTMDFGQIVPLLAEETIPGDEFNIDGQYFSRLAPLVKPTYGKFSFKTVAGFVPYHQIAVDAEAWLGGKTLWEGQVPVQRHFTVYDLYMFIRNFCLSPVAVSEDAADISYVDENGDTLYQKFTNVGRYYIKVLNALGYTISQGANFTSNSAWVNTVGNIRLSAYPLLAYFKLYNDYMSQSTRFNSSELTNFLYCVKYRKDHTCWINSSGQIFAEGINLMFRNLRLNYDNDYFVSAWRSPNSALAESFNIDSIRVPGTFDNQMTEIQHNYDGVVGKAAGNFDNPLQAISQRALDFLKSFDDWVRRNNYSGSRNVQQIYSRFGIKTDDYKSHYAHVYTTDTLPIQVGDVTATANTSGSPLGDYAGKGIMNGGKGVYMKVADYGLILILGYVTVKPMMAYGYDRKVLRNDPMDYYTPEFDGLGADAISVGEVFASPIGSGNVQDNAVYGFTERYNSYRYGRDQITGDFRNYHKNGDMNTWHTGRLLTDVRDAGALLAQDANMNTLSPTDSEYNRMFSITSGDVDHFYITANFGVKAIRPMLNLNQVVKLGEGDTVVPRNGNVVS